MEDVRAGDVVEFDPATGQICKQFTQNINETSPTDPLPNRDQAAEIERLKFKYAKEKAVADSPKVLPTCPNCNRKLVWTGKAVQPCNG